MTQYSEEARKFAGANTGLIDQILTIENLMRMQHSFVENLIETFGKSELLLKVRRSMAEHGNASFFLKTIGITVDSYMREHGMTTEEIESAKVSKILLRTVLMRDPGILIPAALRQNSATRLMQ